MTETHTSLFTTLNENINDFSRFDFILRRFNDDAGRRLRSYYPRVHYVNCLY